MGALLLAILVSLTSVLPGTGLTAKAADPTEHTINFYVYEEYVDAQNQQQLPVSGANVTLTVSNTHYKGMTDKDGKVSIKAVYDADTVTGGTYTVSKTGYEQAEQPTVIKLADYADQSSTQVESALAMEDIVVSQNDVTLEKRNSENGQAEIAITNEIKNEVSNEPGYSWIAEDLNIATVSNGTITAVGKGETKVTVSRFGKEATISVTVKEELSGVQLTVTPSSGTDQKEVTFQLTGMPNEATADVPLYKVQNEKEESLGTLKKDQEWKLTKSDLDLKGNMYFTAKYPGEESSFYLPTEISTAPLNYQQKLDLKLSSDSKEVVYGDQGSIADVVQQDPIDTRILEYASSDSEAVFIDKDTGAYTVLKTDKEKVIITVTAKGNDEYTESTAMFTLEVTKKPITVSKDEIVWDKVSKVYDGTKGVTLTGRVTNTQNANVIGTDDLVIQAEVEVAGTNVTEALYPYKDATILNVSAAGADEAAVNGNYNITVDKAGLSENDTLTELNISITHRPVYLQVEAKETADTTIEYGAVKDDIDKLAAESFEVTLAGEDGKRNDSTASAEEGVLDEDKAGLNSELAAKASVKANFDSNKIYYVGETISVSVDTSSISNTWGNYTLQYEDADEYQGTIQVVQEVTTDDDFWGKIKVQKQAGENSVDLYSENGTLWAAEGDTIIFSSSDGKYDTVNVKQDENSGYGSTYTIPDGLDGQDIKNNIYLSNSNDDDTRTTSLEEQENQDNQIPEGKIKVDGQYPSVTFSKQIMNKVENPSAISFGGFETFTNDAQLVTVSINDTGSGINKASYMLLNIGEIGENNSAINSAIEQSSEDDWISFELSPEGEGTVVVPKSIEGFYIVLVRTSDNVENEVVYASNGLVYEVTEPSVTLNITSTPVDEEFYQGDVEYTLDVTDSNIDVYSGIEEIAVKVIDGDREVAGNEATRTNTYTLENDELNEIKEIGESEKTSYTWEELKKKSSYEIAGKVLADSCNSNTVKIEITAKDQAGNVSRLTETIKLDSTPAIKSISYSDGNANGGYYQNRTMTITYQYANFDPATTGFHVVQNDGKEITTIDWTLQEIENNDIPGIEVAEIQDSEVNNTVFYTKNRLIEYKIIFAPEEGSETDITYQIVPFIRDKAEKEITYSEQEFTIDTIKPKISVDYYLIDEEQGDDNLAEKIDVSSEEAINKATRLYKNKTIRAEVKITERNFGSDQEIFSTSQIDPNFTWIQNDGTDGDVTGFTEAARKVSEWTTDPDNSDVRVQTFDFILEGDYIFGMQYTDLAGNEAVDANNTSSIGYSEHYFTVDKTAPKINVVYKVNGQKIEPGTGEGERLFETDTITAEVTIDERNFFREDEQTQFEQGQMDLIYTAKNFDGNNVTVDDYRGKANTRAGWEKVDDGSSPYVRRQIFTFSEDANYTLKLDYTDLAGNKAVDSSDESIGHAMRYFTVDREAPTGDIIIDGTIFSDFCNMITFGFFTNEQEVVTFTQKDETSGVATAQYYKYIPDVDSKGKFNGLTLEELKAIEEWEDAVPLVLNTEQQAVIYQKIVDRAGHVTYISANEGIIVDKKKPEPHIDITTAEPEHGIYNGNVDFQISVTDSVSGGTYAGLREVYYEVRKDGQVTQQGNYNSEFEDWTQRQQSLIKNETVNANLNNSNNVEIWVKAVDWAGNEQEVTKELAIDITKPTIEVTYDLNSPLNERYYNNTRTATVVVTERNFDPSAVQFDITNTDGTRPSISGWTNSAANGVSDNTTHTCYITYQADGDYTFTMNVTDLANNRTEYGKVDEFTIDQTDPTIQVSYDNNNDETEGYFNENRTATITVTEHNFNAAEVNAMITASLQGSGVSAPGVGGWSTRGDVHTASVTFSQDADYTFDIEYTDLAGNAAADYTEDRFTVDKTAPEIEFFDIEDKSANKGVVAPGVRYSDVNYTEAGVNITIEGAKDEHSVTALSGDRSSIPNGESIKMADFAHTEENDDVYTMKAVIRDKAGNETEETVLFSVNRFGSTYEFAPETKEFLDKFYTNDPQDIIVTERNVDTLVFNGISYGRDGRQTELKEGEDYTVKASGSEVSWKQYIYNISKDNFQEEGRYNVTIDSQDRAENIMNNKVKGLDIEFVVDKTAPTVVVTGIEAGAYREDSRDMTINVADNTAVEKVEVLINGDVKEEYSQKEIEQKNGELTYTIGNDNDSQDVLVVATDLAGNEGSSDEQSVLVTANLFVQFINNTPLLIGTIVALVAIAGGLVWFFLVFKKRKEEQDA